MEEIKIETPIEEKRGRGRPRKVKDDSMPYKMASSKGETYIIEPKKRPSGIWEVKDKDYYLDNAEKHLKRKNTNQVMKSPLPENVNVTLQEKIRNDKYRRAIHDCIADLEKSEFPEFIIEEESWAKLYDNNSAFHDLIDDVISLEYIKPSFKKEEKELQENLKKQQPDYKEITKRLDKVISLLEDIIMSKDNTI